MSSWDTSPWSNFCDPYWEIICHNKWHPGDLRNIHIIANSCRDTLPCALHGTKTTPIFLPANGGASWLLLPGLVSSLSGSTVQPENTYSCILKVTGKVWESQKRIRIFLLKPVSTDLTITWDSVLTNPIGKDGVQGW